MAMFDWSCPACSEKIWWNQRFRYDAQAAPCRNCGARIKRTQKSLRAVYLFFCAGILTSIFSLISDMYWWAPLGQLLSIVAVCASGLFLLIGTGPQYELAPPEDES